MATRKGNLAMVNMLIDHGSDVNKIDDNGITPVHITASM